VVVHAVGQPALVAQPHDALLGLIRLCQYISSAIWSVLTSVRSCDSARSR